MTDTYILSNGHQGDAQAKINDMHQTNEQLERELAEANAKLDATRIRVAEAIQQTKELIELYRKQTP